MFSPSLVQTDSSARRKTMDLARELGCMTSDLIDDGEVAACLRSTPVQKLNAAQTKVSSAFRTVCCDGGPGSSLLTHLCL